MTDRDVSAEPIGPTDAAAPADPADLSEAALRRLNELHDTDGTGRGLFTSDLSVNEFLLVRQAGFRPLGLVVGSSIYHVGVQQRTWGASQELTTLSQAMYHARELAMTRMEAEAQVLGADGVVGVRLRIEFRSFGKHLAEFLAIGTAVKGEQPPAPGRTWRNRKGLPFTSDLSGQEFWTLLRAGYAPLGMVMGSCVYHVAHRSVAQTIRTAGVNAEIPAFTQALYDARELAMERMQAEAEDLGAEGIVGVRLDDLAHIWEGHTTEFFAIGTAIGPVREDHTIPTPVTVLPLTD